MSAVLPLLDRLHRTGRFAYGFAQTDADLEDSLALRHRVFVSEMGAQAHGGPNRETDALDAYCLHVIVRDAHTREMVASTRVLTHEAAIAAGGFYSAHEFDIDRVLACPGRFLEIGRTCVAAEHRHGGAITALWSGLAELVRSDHYDHLIGCASIDLRDGLGHAHAICRRIHAQAASDATRRVRPYRQLPPAAEALPGSVCLPPLIKAYLRIGARVGGPPCHDPDFNVADVFMHLDLGALTPRYARHFLGAPKDMATPGRRLARVAL
ncbi:GNAT family N-acetyltransferase [Salinisphaera sp. Q1T1-3]|uniref:GNAT family N-acetyltransferase n=1 Tax=Salinisphaera sp. Q1T1-3 TaxID=2321229 RepID=UPI000E723473|nr:GNAT family N-acyltransferase [Salinisphaera sp. Q1T1-3]RJS91275.1 GNAT family N-acetyltransferase [Salinisphaera sp. Q1T1-3]